jgi:hypothetical protein
VDFKIISEIKTIQNSIVIFKGDLKKYENKYKKNKACVALLLKKIGIITLLVSGVGLNYKLLTVIQKVH